ncbi:MAG: CocE/NonD family hydrolase [Candidatus Binatus sp.]|uniref:alpha/beta hydrolase n=1 Tax=Candidatus Binatus sp. TaxID=2811406 RepID=UPI002724D1FF|nr:alpha/beta fold hydrolase [Candidatus Binatus sp.]MDO8433475.1 CocE/NonD family hydrolase [Candidatus Binatus sp.]
MAEHQIEEQHVTFKSGDLLLEGGLANPGGGAPAAVVCHPHPMYGGSMHNNVVDAILAALRELGYATLRFNFRGVGGSEGEYDGGPGEVDDAKAAMEFLLAQPGVSREGATLAGYSFGAMVAMTAGYESGDVARIVTVALPTAMADARVPADAIKPMLLISGDRDSHSPLDSLKAVAAKIGAAATLEVVAGADHFFGGYEKKLAEKIMTALR